MAGVIDYEVEKAFELVVSATDDAQGGNSINRLYNFLSEVRPILGPLF